jgi:type IV secretory pathway VirB10-like protein
MSTTPQPPRQPEPIVNQHYQPAQGAIPIDRLKRVGIGVGVLFLAIFTLWGIFHKSAAPGSSQKASRITLTSPAQVDSQQAELQREMQEAARAAQEAELAKQRAMHPGSNGNEGPRNAQVDPEAQLRAQMRLDDIRRQHQAAYASTVAFAPTGGHPEASNTTPTAPPSGQPLQQTTAESKAAQLPTDTPAASRLQDLDPPPGTYRLDEGTIIETILLNRLDGEFAGPVITQVSTDVYSKAGLELLIPKGSRFLGEAKEVNSFDQRRLAVVFHRLILPNQKSLSLDKFRGLDQIGETGIVSKVDHHYLEIFGTSLALGAIGGLAQIGSYGGVGYDPAVGFRIGVTERMGSSAEQVLSKFLNKLPTIKVIEGSRIKIILTNDLNVEPYE